MLHHFGNNLSTSSHLTHHRHVHDLRDLASRQYGTQPVIYVLAPWPSHFGFVYEQFLNSGIGQYGGFPGGVGSYGAGLQGVPIGLGDYSVLSQGYRGSHSVIPRSYGGGYGAGSGYPNKQNVNWNNIGQAY